MPHETSKPRSAPPARGGHRSSGPSMSIMKDNREATMIGCRSDGTAVRRPLSPHLQAYDMLQMTSALSTQKEIDLVYAHNDPGAHGAYLAAKEAGREKSMKLIGIDALPQEGIQYVRQGILDATFSYPTGGQEAIDTALKILGGQTVEKKIVLGTRLYTKENISKGGQEIQ